MNKAEVIKEAFDKFKRSPDCLQLSMELRGRLGGTLNCDQLDQVKEALAYAFRYGVLDALERVKKGAQKTLEGKIDKYYEESL